MPQAARRQIVSIPQQLADFFKSAKATDGPISTALKSLDDSLRQSFNKAMQLLPHKAPRTLRKQPGPVTKADLVKEIEGKGFVRVKDGTPAVGGTRQGGNVGDARSEIYLRRVSDAQGNSHFEAVRIDDITANPNLKAPANPNRPSDGAIRKVTGDGHVSGSQRQYYQDADGINPRRSHHAM